MLQASGRERPARQRTADVPIQMHERPQEKNLKHVRVLLPACSPRTDIASLEEGTRRLAPRCLPNRQAEAADAQGVLAGSAGIGRRKNAGGGAGPGTRKTGGWARPPRRGAEPSPAAGDPPSPSGGPPAPTRATAACCSSTAGPSRRSG